MVTFAHFVYSNEITEFLTIVSHPTSVSYSQLVSYDTLDYVYNDQVGTQFSAVTTSVPEPAGWAMMIGGFGLVGGAMRQRRRSVTVSFA